ncbi:Holliday junction resolvase RuvX [Phototrophicus methaneseepsis]|uniref:Putative pre-16S rRNA nuclease n=1 Tax=Phototrophicus methaneseepsis TaxID=2710758 RepID=A0A7S8IDK1_9CHLR|nr:Holliday junction resolvase RuvX [Phototrophicus methaneseepsis]QPC80893.1 Holliday junction resolvase RuvX [Phototrophicus methaneseepsis]
MIGRLIGLDHGLARIGIAVSDASGIVARELLVLDRASKQEDFAKINQIAIEHNAIAFIVGIPYSDAPEEQYTQADKVRTWIGRFQEQTDLPIIEWDEQLTSDDAREIAKIQKRDRRAPIDDLAARLILQSYLDALKDGLAPPPPRP